MEAIDVQDNGTEASHGTTMEDISMDERAANVEGTETCQGELTIEDGSLGNGFIDVDGAQSHGAERLSDAQGVQVVGGNGSMVSGSIVGAGSQLGAAEHVGARPFEAESEAAPSNGIPRPSNWQERTHRARKNWSRRYVWNGKYEGSE